MRLLPCWLMLVLMTGCGGTVLEGSVAEQTPLEFNDLLLRKQGTDLVVQYQDRSDVVIQIVLKLAVDMYELPENRRLSGDEFLRRVSLSRAMLDHSQLPQVLHGTLVFDQLAFEHDGAVLGDFSAIFVDQTTLHGQFTGRLTEVLVE